MRRESVSSLLNPSLTDLISSLFATGGEKYIPLSPTKRVYISVDELLKKHDRRVAAAFQRWKEEYFTS